jgi:hypothetical protein
MATKKSTRRPLKKLVKQIRTVRAKMLENRAERLEKAAKRTKKRAANVRAKAAE